MVFSAPPVLIVGLPRSGTSLVCEILGGHPDVALLVEPHALWKSGDFACLDDGDRIPATATRQWIRAAMSRYAAGRQLVEKSPVNCLRPERVHAVFPDAKVIYIERDAASCVFSNMQRSASRDAFKPSLVLKKYMGKTGEQQLPHARSYFPIWKQLRWRDAFSFLGYVVRMMALRRQGKVPFGPRLAGFSSQDPASSWQEYHCAVWEKAQQAKAEFARVYRDQMYTVRLEELAASPAAARQLFSFIGLPVSDAFLEKCYDNISLARTQKAVVPEALALRFTKVESV